MPYAANNEIAFDKFEGAIKITQEQYLEALEGMQEGLIVTIDDGFKVSAPVPPSPAPEPIPTPEEIAHKALIERDQLLAAAAIRIAPLQDAVDLGNETPGDVATLKQWKQYRIELNRIEQQAGFPLAIDWPVMPS